MKSMLVFPPGWSPVGPYLALPVLKAYLKEKKGIDVCIRDLNVLFYDELLSKESILAALEKAKTAKWLSSKERLTIDLVKSSCHNVEWANKRQTEANQRADSRPPRRPNCEDRIV